VFSAITGQRCVLPACDAGEKAMTGELPLHRQVIRGRIVHFQVLGRAEVRVVRPELPHLLISITHPGSPEAVLSGCAERVACLRLQFEDADGGGGDCLMSADEAEAIVAFVEQHRDRAELIVCQCEAGMSRSAGVAAALSRWLNEDDQIFFARFYPNRHVYRTVLNAAMTRTETQEDQ
jgi:predicted protein tyrosine phosphatase